MYSAVTTLDFIRHGACQGGEIFRGTSDVLLTDQGWRQMDDRLAKYRGWDKIYSSPMLRCQQFASEFAKQKSLTLTLEDRLREIYFGEWEGQPIEAIAEKYQEAFTNYWADPLGSTPPGAETMVDFQQRVTAALTEILQQQQNKHVLIVAHGAVIRVLCCHLMEMPLTCISNIATPYAGFCRFEINHRDGYDDWIQLSVLDGEPI